MNKLTFLKTTYPNGRVGYMIQNAPTSKQFATANLHEKHFPVENIYVKDNATGHELIKQLIADGEIQDSSRKFFYAPGFYFECFPTNK